jgi:ubiquinone/menaquinone biosynthesis C-methylase UbiE/predicted O-methyltransferase YrrM
MLDDRKNTKPASPFMNELEIVAIESCLHLHQTPVYALEWGGGYSTLHFPSHLPFGSTWDSVEHDAQWANKIKAFIDGGSVKNTVIHLVENNNPFPVGSDGDYDSFKNYILFPTSLNKTFDLIIVDGRARKECLQIGWMLLKGSGVMILHDAQRVEYQSGIPKDCFSLRMINPTIYNEGPISVLFVAKSPDTIGRLYKTLQGKLPNHIMLNYLSNNLCECDDNVANDSLNKNDLNTTVGLANNIYCDIRNLQKIFNEFNGNIDDLNDSILKWFKICETHSDRKDFYLKLKTKNVIELSNIYQRFTIAINYLNRPLIASLDWLVSSNETTNYTYDLEELNKTQLAWFISQVTGKHMEIVKKYFMEIESDNDLKRHISVLTRASKKKAVSDDIARYGRRLGWYALVRAIRPKIVVETGVDKGLGTCVLAAALMKNHEEGFTGHLFATDIDESAGFLFKEPYNRFGTIIYGDSKQTLAGMTERIDVFIHDSDHSSDYERTEYQTIKGIISEETFLISDNAHANDELAKFAEATNRQFLYFQERPLAHFYGGAGIGVAFARSRDRSQRSDVCHDVQPAAMMVPYRRAEDRDEQEELGSQERKLESKTAASIALPVARWEANRPEATQTVINTHQSGQGLGDNPTIIFLNTYYPQFLENHYRANPDLLDASYEQQKSALQSKCFGDSDFYSEAMIKARWSAADLIVNCMSLQRTWADENGFEGHSDGLEVAVEQIRRLHPEVLYFQDLGVASQSFVSAVRPYTELICGQIASRIPPGADLGGFDIIFSSFPHFVQRFRHMGIASYHQPLAFEPRALGQLPACERRYDVTFLGGVSLEHKGRIELLEYLAERLPIEFWGYGVEMLPANSWMRKQYHGEAWGLEMFSVLQESFITINQHSEVAENYANNMRLFEATGCGALLITDYKDNLHTLFEVGEEIVAYRSPEECVALVQYYLAHPQEAQAIARAGQARTLRDHTYGKRLQKTAEILARYRRNRNDGHRFLPPNTSQISYGYTPVNPLEVSDAMTSAWKDERIPVRQRALVQQELAAMYAGQPPIVYQVLADILRPYVFPNCSILEIGCASGYYYESLEYLLNTSIAYTGLDYSKALVSMAKKYYPQAEFAVADGASLPFGNNRFLVVVSSCILLHVTNYKQHIAETTRVAEQFVVVHRTPICRQKPTQYFKKMAYNIETVELQFNETEILTEFISNGLELMKSTEYYSNPRDDKFEVTYVFKKVRQPL